MSVPTDATKIYPVRDVDGRLVAEHVRKDLQDGSKQCMWRQPSGKWGLNGTRLEELPLYGIERLRDLPKHHPVILVEGEKAADAINDTGYLFAVGTVTGASATPGDEAFAPLKGREVIMWPDADEAGRRHMEGNAEKLAKVSDYLRLYDWPEAPKKGADAADHPAVLTGSEKALGILLDDLLGAPEWAPMRPSGGPPTPNGRSQGDGDGPGRFNLTDMGNAERFVARHGDDVRYCYPWGKWLTWTGARWERDDSGRVHRLAKETVRSIYREASEAEEEGSRKAIAQHATRSEAEAKIKAMLELAKSELPVSPDDLDADPWLLNVPNGTVDLKAGELRRHRREDLLTKMAGAEYHPEAEAPAWEAFLERVLPGEELRRFVCRGAGYSATGDTSEQCMFINHGAGANGKSTFQEALAEVLGDYSMRAPTEMLMTKRSGGVPNDVARLKGARFVAASETEEGRRLAESLVKDLTGQDTITARFMRAEFFDFKPTHKLWLATNHKPEIRGTDNAIWRRIRLVPWSVVVPPAERDRKLPEKLRAEAAGIMAWVVRGCLEWRSGGLGEPEEVRDATARYRAEQDVLATFMEERCVVAPNASAPATPLYQAYKAWCEESGERVETQKKFGMRLAERGFEREKSGVYYWLGIGLLYDGDDDPGPSGPSGPKNDISSSKPVREPVICEQGPEGPEGPKDAGSIASELASYLADPPADLLRQARKCAAQGAEASPLFKPLVSSVSYGVFGTVAGRWDQVRPAVSEWVCRLQGDS